jgi:outer membrane protein insertion porin family
MFTARLVALAVLMLAAPAAWAQTAAPAPAQAAPAQAASADDPEPDGAAPAAPPGAAPPAAAPPAGADGDGAPAGEAPAVPSGPRLCPTESGEGAVEHPPSGLADGSTLVGFAVRGDFQDDDATVDAVIGQLLPQGASYGPEREACLFTRLDKLKYRFTLKGERRPGGLFLIVKLHPATLIRRVDVSLQFGLFRTVFFPHIPDDDVRSRLRYREGSAVPDDLRDRGALLEGEARRLEDWMARQGFFEARVAVYTEEDSEYAVILHVDVSPGPVYELGKVVIEGNVSIADEDIYAQIAHTRLGVEKRFTKDDLNGWLDDIRALYQRNKFYGVRVRSNFDTRTSFDRRRKKVDLTITITERKKIDVALEGNESVSQDEIEKVLTFDDENNFDDFSAANSADAIRQLYQEKGFYQAVVTWERVHLLPTFERIFFYIDEGPKQKVARVTFVGNDHVSSATLSALVATQPYGTLKRKGGYLTPLQLSQDVDAIVDLYRRLGYSSVRVEARVAPRKELLDDGGALAAAVTAEALGGSLYVRFAIVEGPQDQIDVVEFVGNRALNDAELEGGDVRPGEPFDPAALEVERERLVRIYNNEGFSYAKISPRFFLIPGEPGHYHVTFSISEGPPVTVGKTLVRGNFRTKSWVVRRVLALDEGDTLTISAIREGRDALSATGLFSAVNLDMLGLSDEELQPTVHPLVDVQERYDNNGDFQFGFGYRTDADFYMTGGYFYRNLVGVGAALSAEGIWSFRDDAQETQRAIESNFRLPYWVMDRYPRIPLDLNVKAFYRQEKEPRFGELKKLGGSLGLSRAIGRGVVLSTTYSYVSTTVFQELVRGAGASEQRDTFPVPTTTSSIGLALIVDRRKDACASKSPRPALITPECGYKVQVGAEWTASVLGGSEDFLKFGGSLAYFSLLSRRIVLSNGLRYDHGVPLDGVLLPETERFFAGGNTTIRGLEEDFAATEVIEAPLPPGGAVVTTLVRPAGGNLRALYNLDLQLKVCGSCFLGAPIAAAVFYDMGLVTNSFARFDPGKLRHSVGLALFRVITPVVSVSFEYAMPLDPGPGDDKTGRVHLNFGFVLN